MYCVISIRNNNKNGRNFDNVSRKPNLIKILSHMRAFRTLCAHNPSTVLYFSLHFTGTIHLLLHTNSIHGLESGAFSIRPSVFALRYAASMLHLFSFIPSKNTQPWGNDLVS